MAALSEEKPLGTLWRPRQQLSPSPALSSWATESWATQAPADRGPPADDEASTMRKTTSWMQHLGGRHPPPSPDMRKPPCPPNPQHSHAPTKVKSAADMPCLAASAEATPRGPTEGAPGPAAQQLEAASTPPPPAALQRPEVGERRKLMNEGGRLTVWPKRRDRFEKRPPPPDDGRCGRDPAAAPSRPPPARTHPPPPNRSARGQALLPADKDHETTNPGPSTLDPPTLSEPPDKYRESPSTNYSLAWESLTGGNFFAEPNPLLPGPGRQICDGNTPLSATLAREKRAVGTTTPPTCLLRISAGRRCTQGTAAGHRPHNMVVQVISGSTRPPEAGAVARGAACRRGRRPGSYGRRRGSRLRNRQTRPLLARPCTADPPTLRWKQQRKSVPKDDTGTLNSLG